MYGDTRPRLRTCSVARVITDILRKSASGIEARIVDGCADRQRERNDSRPGGKRVVFLVVNRWAGADLGGEFFDGQAQDRSCFQLALVGLARILPTAGQDVF